MSSDSISTREPLSLALSRLRVRHLQFLDLLALHGSVRQVAKELGIAQPAAMSLAEDLEFAFGVQIVVRDPRGATLTPVARVILERARVALAEVAVAKNLANTHATPRHCLRVGASAYMMCALVPRAVERFRNMGFDARLELHEKPLKTMMTQLAAGELDAVIGCISSEAIEATGADIETTLLFADNLSVVVGRTHALASRRGISLVDTLVGPWVLPRQGSHSRTVIENAFLSRGLLPPEPDVEIYGFAQMLRIAAICGMLAAVPGVLLRQGEQAIDALALKVGVDLQTPPYVFANRLYREPMKDLVHFRSSLLEAAREYAGS